jgi:hypothetical protein
VNPTPEVLAELAQLPPEIPLLVSEDPVWSKNSNPA